MKKLKDIIEKIIYDGKFPKGITPYMVDVLIDIYNNINNDTETEFIEKDIKILLDKCGIKTKEHGIGWIAYR